VAENTEDGYYSENPANVRAGEDWLADIKMGWEGVLSRSEYEIKVAVSASVLIYTIFLSVLKQLAAREFKCPAQLRRPRTHVLGRTVDTRVTPTLGAGPSQSIFDLSTIGLILASRAFVNEMKQIIH